MKQVEVPESIYSQDGHILVHIMHQMYVDIDTARYYQYTWTLIRTQKKRTMDFRT